MPCRPGFGSGFLSRCSRSREYQHTVVPAVTATRAGAATLPRPKGAGPPVGRVRDGTSAALDNPRWPQDGPVGIPPYQGYGAFDGVTSPVDPRA